LKPKGFWEEEFWKRKKIKKEGWETLKEVNQSEGKFQKK